MRIGIDIDNTLTEIQDELNKAAFDYAISLGKKIENYDNPMEDIKNNGDTYRKKFQSFQKNNASPGRYDKHVFIVKLVYTILSEKHEKLNF